jgi:hypothetical protein
LNKSIAIALFALIITRGFAQQQTEVQHNLEEGIQARYRVTVVGASAFGLKGGEDSIRKLGGTILVMKKGLYGAFDRKEITSNAIAEGKRTLLTGKEEVELQPGERFYANSVRVGPDFVTVGLLSVDPRTMQGRVGRVWASVNFFFPTEVVKTGDLKAINAAMDQWLLPADSMPNMPANPVKTFTVAAGLPSTVELKPGMTRDEVLSGLGNPAQTITFGNRTWLTYPALVAVIEDGKLTTVDRAEDSAGRLTLSSDPAGSEIYVDGDLAGTTPASLRVPVGAHKVELKSQGKTVWAQDMRVFPGAEINLKPGTADGK